jgi:hypothetical protein
LQQTGFQHGASGTFAVGASDSDDAGFEVQTKTLGHFLHPIQTHVYRMGVQTLAVREPTIE